ncbi:MAG TPA: flagellar hook-basal body complex protein FliE [Steroidobacteraceae bacterium]|nr:flagellar hook-basal body complex protein FliE [Steroidobacteraceae bacterium]
MSQMEIDGGAIARVLAQIRSLSAQARAGGATGPDQTQQTGSSEFATLLKKGIDQVNQTEQSATTLADKFERGVPGVDLPQVMLEMQKATVSFRALTEVRNRLVSAYQDIMNMQI